LKLLPLFNPTTIQKMEANGKTTVHQVQAQPIESECQPRFEMGVVGPSLGATNKWHKI
jgi:hypothetical protein